MWNPQQGTLSAVARAAAVAAAVALVTPARLAAWASDGFTSGGRLVLRTATVDTASRENLLGSDDFAIAPGERLIIQLDGPITGERRAALESAGVALGQYLPEWAYIVDAAVVNPSALRALGFVTWLGRFDPEWKIDPELGTRPAITADRADLREQGLEAAVVTTFDGASPDEAIDALDAAGATVLGAHRVGNHWMIDALIAPRLAQELATRATVQFIESAPDGTERNDSNRWIVQSNVLNQTPVWDRGLHGEGQVAGLIDSTPRESHCMFDDGVAPGDPTHRKFVGWRNASTIGSHGTHVAGTLAGDAPPYFVYTVNDGLAYAARMSFSNSGHVFTNPSTLYERFVDAHADGARCHSNSWGDDGTQAYTTWCRQIDEYCYDYEDGFVAFAISNGAVVRTPENATSVLAVASCFDAPNQHQWAGGGIGPTIDGRRKPEIFAPGNGTISAAWFAACDVTAMTGTSMACPAVSAAAVLARQYFTSGYYPSGAARTADGFVPSGALLRAALINGSVDMTGVPGYPSDREGWGRLLLDDALYFTGDAARLLVHDVRNADGLATGEVFTAAFSLASAAVPLRITMAYTQPPAAVNAADPVINNLDLELIGPGGVLYRGNVFADGQSAEGGSADPRNSVERIVRENPAIGQYTLTVRGTQVNAGPGVGRQGFAVVVNGDLAGGCPTPPLGDLDGDCHVGLTDLTAFLSAFGFCVGEPGYQPAADFDSSGCVNLGDLTSLLANFGA